MTKRFFEGRDGLEGGLFRHGALQFGLPLIGAPISVLQAMEPVPVLLGDTIFAAVHVRNIVAQAGLLPPGESSTRIAGNQRTTPQVATGGDGILAGAEKGSR